MEVVVELDLTKPEERAFADSLAAVIKTKASEADHCGPGRGLQSPPRHRGQAQRVAYERPGRLPRRAQEQQNQGGWKHGPRVKAASDARQARLHALRFHDGEMLDGTPVAAAP
jgi:hypothetical protein